MSTNDQAPLIDAHVHSDHERFAPDPGAVVRRAEAAGVIAQIVPAISAARWPRLRSLCAEHAGLHPCYGLHPCFIDEHADSDVIALAEWIGRERPVAVGECGLDHVIEGLDRRRQQHLFAAQLALAREFDLPIVIHARQAVEEVIRMIRQAGHYRGLVHSFNGSEQQAHRLIDLGYSLSFGGAVTWSRATRLRKLVARLPLEALLLETDAPDQVDQAHAGQRNEAAWLVDVWRSIADLRPESAELIARRTSENAVRLFDLPISLPAAA